MRLPVKPIRGKVRSDGKSIIYFQYCYSWDPDLKTLLNMGIEIPAGSWDKQKECITVDLPREYGTCDKLNEELDRQLRLAEDLIKLAKKQGIAEIGPYVKERYSPTLNLAALALAEFNMKTPYMPKIKKRKAIYFQQLGDYVESKRKWVKPATITVYNNMIGHFEAFEKYRERPITFSSFDDQFYEDFRDFLTFENEIPRKKKPVYGLRENTIGKTIKQLRIFIKDRVKRKIIPAIDLSDYKIPEEETDAIYLTYEEIGCLYNLDLSECPELEPYRRWFVLACLTGLRFSDFSALGPEDLLQDMLYRNSKNLSIGLSSRCERRQRRFSRNNLKRNCRRSAIRFSISR